MSSTPNQGLYLIFDNNAVGPTILCSANGNLPPAVEWIRENGRGLPSGISQLVQPNGDVVLRWQRPMEFTDSGSYLCQASNNIGNSSTFLEILVQRKCVYIYIARYCVCVCACNNQVDGYSNV